MFELRLCSALMTEVHACVLVAGPKPPIDYEARLKELKALEEANEAKVAALNGADPSTPQQPVTVRHNSLRISCAFSASSFISS